MLDTIKLTLDKSLFSLANTNSLANGKRSIEKGYFKIIQNPNKHDSYMPKLTLIKRHNYLGKFEPTLYIEFSLPKLVFGNNFDELSDEEFDNSVKMLHSVLNEQMGINITKNNLINAQVSAIHYSKNIPITDGRFPKYWIDKIAEANNLKILTTNKTDYRNEGYLYKLHANSYEVAFYDKIKDLQQAKISDLRAYSRDNSSQLDLLSLFEKKQGFFEVLRMEVRLNNRQKIKSLLKKLNISESLTFKDLYSSTKSSIVLNYYLNEIKAKRPIMLNHQKTKMKEFISKVKVENPKIKTSILLKLMGLKSAVEEMGIREVKELVFDSNRNWYHLISQMNQINLPMMNDPINELGQKLVEYEPLRLVDFQDRMINNDKYD